jgi:hypothetical protein
MDVIRILNACIAPEWQLLRMPVSRLNERQGVTADRQFFCRQVGSANLSEWPLLGDRREPLDGGKGRNPANHPSILDPRPPIP